VGVGAFEFVVLATLRAGQLTRGCRPRVDAHTLTAVTAQREVAGGFIVRTPAVVRTAAGAGAADDPASIAIGASAAINPV
jgi:hypothetical protein